MAHIGNERGEKNAANHFRKEKSGLDQGGKGVSGHPGPVGRRVFPGRGDHRPVESKGAAAGPGSVPGIYAGGGRHAQAGAVDAAAYQGLY
jgi:hypothetical protein